MSPSTKNWYFASWPDLIAQIATSPSLVSSAKASHVWLKKKGWPLNSEDAFKRKLADVLFSAALFFKLLPETSATFRSVMYIF